MTQTLNQQPTTPPSKSELASRLRALATHMLDVAVDMEYYGGFSEMALHGQELRGAAGIAASWADAIITDQDIPGHPCNSKPA